MKIQLLLKHMFLLCVFALSSSVWGQTNIIPVRTDVGGFPTWTDNNVAGSAYVQLLKATSSTITPAMDFNSFTGETLNFKARTFGGSTAAEIILTVSISIDNGTNWIVLGTRTPASSSMNTQAPFDLSSYNGTQVKVKFSVGGTADGIGVGIDDIAFTGIPAASGPEIVASPSSLTGFTYIVGSGPSAEKSFNLSGSNLTNDITATAPANFEVSTTTGTGFGSAVTLTQTGGNVASTTLYVRMIAGLPVNTYGGNMVLTSTGATAVNIALSGNVTPMPAKPIITAPTAQSGTVGVAYFYQIVASENPTSYALASGALPTGFTLNTTTGVISGTPTAAGAFNATITATNAAGTSDPVAFELTVSKGTQSATLPNLTVNVGDGIVTLPSQTSAGITINYASSNNSVASVTGNMLTVGTAGSATITANNPGDSNYELFNTSFTVTVSTAPCFVEDFSSAIAGDNINTSGSSNAWEGNDKFPTVDRAYQAGGAIKIGSGSSTGSVNSKVLSTIAGDVNVSFDVKGWTSVEGDIVLTLGGQSKTITYTAKITDAFESRIVNFTNVPLGSTLKIATSAKRAFIDNVEISCGTATVWNGTAWSNGTPDVTKDVIIAGAYNETDAIVAKSITVNETSTLMVNTFISTGNVTNNGEITVANNANFVHTGTFTAGTSSAFKVNRLTNPVQRLDYNSWSSPLKNSAQTLKQFSPATLDARFLTYNNGLYQSVTNPSVATFNAAQGYLIRTPNNYTTTPEVFSGVFEGTEPNAGPVSYDPSGITGDFVFLGNPYPSAISMADFVTANPQIDGTFYIWDSSVKMINNAYSGNNYVTHTSAGSVPAGSPFIVPVAQGFFVNRGASANAFTFNNAMRRTVETGVFAKEALATDRFWLQMTAPSGAKPQMLIGFFQNGTAGYDTGLDGKMFETNADVIYSNVDNNSLIINALGTFNTDEKVNVTANFLADGNYTIGLAQKEGIFAGSQKIYLKDNVTGTETELTAGDYSFAATAGLQNDRFTVYFKFVVLGNSDVTVNQSIIYVSGNTVHAKAKTKIAALEVYDMSGKVIKKLTNINSDKASLPMTYTGVALVKMVLENGETVTKKIILN